MRFRRPGIAWLAALLAGVLAFGGSGAGGMAPSVAEAARVPRTSAAVVGSPGTSVTITGANFGATTTAMFGWPGQQVVIPTATKCAIGGTGCLVSRSATSLVVKAPATYPSGPAFGFVPILVCTNGASVATCEQTPVPGIPKVNGNPGFVGGFVYGPAVTKMSPNGGQAGTVVTLSGGKFGTTDLPTVTFVDQSTQTVAATIGGPGASKCTSTTQRGCIKSFGDSSVVVVAPDNLPPRLYAVQLVAGSPPAFADFLAPNLFSYGPVVFSNTPVGGQGGTTVTIKGANFGKGTPAVVRFQYLGGAPDVDVSSTCVGAQVGCFTTAHTADTITLKAPAGAPNGPPFALMQVFISGVPADDLTAVPSSFGQSTMAFNYGPVIAGSTGLLFAKPGTALQIKGANFGALAGVQLGDSTFIVDRCSATTTHTCISSLSDTGITVKPPPELSGQLQVYVVSARMISGPGYMYAQTVPAMGGFIMNWTTSPVVTNIS